MVTFIKYFDIQTKKQNAMKMVKEDTDWSSDKQKQIELINIREGKKIMEYNNIKTNEMGKQFIINYKETLYTKNKNVWNGISVIETMYYNEIISVYKIT